MKTRTTSFKEYQKRFTKIKDRIKKKNKNLKLEQQKYC